MREKRPGGSLFLHPQDNARKNADTIQAGLLEPGVLALPHGPAFPPATDRALGDAHGSRDLLIRHLQGAQRLFCEHAVAGDRNFAAMG
jgi:hypothetical protein